MVFGFFTKSKGAEANTSGPASTNQPQEQTQLRTPSPSEPASVDHAPLSPADALRSLKIRSWSASPAQMPLRNPVELRALIKVVPPKTLYDYVLSRLPRTLDDAPEHSDVLLALSSFFAELEPPPRLHCVRCHKGFAEVENTDRSCLVPHDDDSAEVEHVGLSGGAKNRVAGGLGSTYQTMWGCCGKLVEGDGDQGPPDGWCYEGKHTTDVKRARFRADSTPHDDKLVPCSRLRCFSRGELGPHGRSQRARARKSLKEDTDEDEDGLLAKEAVPESDDDAGSVVKGSRGVGSSKPIRGKGGKRKRKSDVDAMEVEGDAGAGAGAEDAKSVTSGSARMGDAPKAKPRAKPKNKVETMKPKGTPKAKRKEDGGEDAEMAVEPALEADSASPVEAKAQAEVTASISTPLKTQKPKPKPKRPRKSGAADGGKYVPPKEEDAGSSELEEEDERPRKRKRKSTA